MQFWSKIKHVVTKSWLQKGLILDQNCTTRSTIATLLYSFWNLQNKKYTETIFSYYKRFLLPGFREVVAQQQGHWTFNNFNSIMLENVNYVKHCIKNTSNKFKHVIASLFDRFLMRVFHLFVFKLRVLHVNKKYMMHHGATDVWRYILAMFDTRFYIYIICLNLSR